MTPLSVVSHSPSEPLTRRIDPTVTTSSGSIDGTSMVIPLSSSSSTVVESEPYPLTRNGIPAWVPPRLSISISVQLTPSTVVLAPVSARWLASNPRIMPPTAATGYTDASMDTSRQASPSSRRAIAGLPSASQP